MKNTMLFVISLLILLAMGGFVSGEAASSAETGVVTNVHFCKMIKVGDKYEFQPLYTLYTGENDFGRLTFIAGAEKFENGDYALVQDTPGGLELIQTLKIEPSGSETPEYVILNLQLTKNQLPVPLKLLGDSGTLKTPAPIAPTSTTLVTTPSAAAAVTAVATMAMPAPTKSPVSPLILFAALGITGLVCAKRMRN